MSEIVLNAQLRSELGKKAKAVRRQEMIPGVFYAREEKPIPIKVTLLSLNPLIYTSETHVVDLRLGDGSARKCILRDVQFDPVSDIPLHFDLQGLHENEELTVEVPVVLVGGTAPGVKEGGMLQQVIHKISVSCLPRHIPEKLEVDISGLGINDAIHVGDLPIPNVEVLANPEDTVVVVVPPRVVAEAPVAAEGEEVAPAEPEVVGKGKKEGEEGEEEGKES
jgi:large subunit ribosomal protein L25